MSILAGMTASGITRRRPPADNEVICTLHDERTPGLAAELGTTRTAAAVDLWGDRLAGAVVAIGNAPTALYHLLDRLRDGELPITVTGRRGGSAITCAALNALATKREILP